jgi:DNA polymerase III alpha subunit
MINLKTRTEFTFREVFGPIEKVLAATSGPVGICDRNGTWGHVAFEAACTKAGRKPLLGAELAVVADMKTKGEARDKLDELPCYERCRTPRDIRVGVVRYGAGQLLLHPAHRLRSAAGR